MSRAPISPARRRIWRGLLALALLALPSAVFAQQAETIEYYGTDAIGSIRIVWDASGNVTARMDYTPFGEPVLQQGTAIPKEGFVGNESDAETNQGYFHVRMFEARTGRFTRTDPIEDGVADPQRWNRYAYALNDPLTAADSTGLNAFYASTSNPGCQTFPIYCDDQSVWDNWFLSSNADWGGGSSDSYQDRQHGGQISTTTPTTTTPTQQQQQQHQQQQQQQQQPTVAQACVQGGEAFVDGVIPFGDPLKSMGLYDLSTPGLSFSQSMGEDVRNFALSEYIAGAILSYVSESVGAAGQAGNTTAKMISNNRYVRLGLSYMGRGPKSPALRFGNASSDLGKYLTHVDLTPDFRFSKQVLSICRPK